MLKIYEQLKESDWYNEQADVVQITLVGLMEKQSLRKIALINSFSLLEVTTAKETIHQRIFELYPNPEEDFPK